MEHESFEDPIVAAIQNENFINIKVDRKSVPTAIDLYEFVQITTGRGVGR